MSCFPHKTFLERVRRVLLPLNVPISRVHILLLLLQVVFEKLKQRRTLYGSRRVLRVLFALRRNGHWQRPLRRTLLLLVHHGLPRVLHIESVMLRADPRQMNGLLLLSLDQKRKAVVVCRL